MISRAFDAKSWDKLIASLPNPHLLQTWEWAQVKAKHGWQPMPFVWESADSSRPAAAAMVLKRVIPVGGFSKRMCVLYIPKGPLMDWNKAALRQRVLDDLQSYARRQGAIFIKIDPDVVLGGGVPSSEDNRENNDGQKVMSDLTGRRWQFSSDQIQFRNTILMDIAPSEDELLARMKPKTRYNIRLAEKKGVTMHSGSLADLPLLYQLYAETSVRDGFVIRDEGYYQHVWQTFMEAAQFRGQSSIPWAELLIAKVDDQPVAAIFIFYFAGKAYYLYGMSRDQHREMMPNHLLQWEAVKRAKKAGCVIYDLWGAPDKFDESDGLWGVFRFKEGLGGQVVRTLGAWDYPASPVFYKWYTQMLPMILGVMRLRGKARMKHRIDG